MSTSANPERPNKVIMGLGIATVVLLSANLIAVLAQRAWPALQDLSFFKSDAQTEELAPVSEHSTIHITRLPNWHRVEHLSPGMHETERCNRHIDHEALEIAIQTGIQMDDFDFDFDFDFDEADLDVDLERLEYEIQDEMSRLEHELSNVEESLEGAIRLKMEGNNALVLNGDIDIEELERKLQRVTEEFSVRVSEHENAARHGKVIVRERK